METNPDRCTSAVPHYVAPRSTFRTKTTSPLSLRHSPFACASHARIPSSLLQSEFPLLPTPHATLHQRPTHLGLCARRQRYTSRPPSRCYSGVAAIWTLNASRADVLQQIPCV